ncbi:MULTISPECIES: type IX secretion system plug protein [unclassified Cellulophaga]|uniref:type IX secretion system plug protein n=1 Tax=unclassified Cellulophaga TaxID=2634405 RepID=UPI0026E3FA93|nr:MULTISPECIES: type IX secretion system plug protein domain-containing protein [unclassified Cellulophaga]MDO6492985.1 DUF5103 domain-containing protein [Cellulophaga sp. 2_MG-2023]MDO6496197.1 DUF5103 domain-containing protein [Cellulophaga sp. 3_MG-2023]
MKQYTLLFSLLLSYFSIFGQNATEKDAPKNIKSIIFKGPTEDQFPVAQLGDPLTLEFDDITASEEDYYYKITYYNYDWTPSSLSKSQYLSGFDNLRITNYENSYNTLQAYSNYRLQIPNNNLSLKVSGNYMLEIYNNYNELQFSRRFVIYKDAVLVGVSIKRTRDFEFLNQKQAVQIAINAGNFQLINPKNEVKVTILQNYYWPSAITNLKPQYTIGKELLYKYDKESNFFGGNEFLNFTTKDLRATSTAIARVQMKELYNHYMYADILRANEPYTYYPDINGDFVVTTQQGEDASRESEYTNVHFKLPYTDVIGLNDVYVFGKFNNYAITDENKMTYNEDTGYLETSIMLKQGFYNYKYVLKTDKDELKYNAIGGNFHFTENNYLVLVYYRNFGDQYDSVIGVGNGNSRNITN